VIFAMVKRLQMTQVEPAQKRTTIVDYIKLDSIVDSAHRTLGERGKQFLTSILSLANNNPAIMECEPRSVYAACLTAATLDLPINPNLGFAYIIPYKNKGVAQAQFQMGYKGFIQLAIRSGEFRHIGANEVREGQLEGFNDVTGEPKFNFNVEEPGEVMGFMAYFELLNGFQKSFYMTNAQVEKHAKKYSQSYKKNFGVWKDDFNGMAKKTVLKLLLSKFAPLSIEMQRAIEDDQKVADEYADNKITFDVEDAAIEGEAIEVDAVEDDIPTYTDDGELL
jgi:recombination protein RecT